MMNFVYQLNNIKFTYGQEFVLHIPNLNIERGIILGITGPNGSGKTTLLKILGFLLTSQQGDIKYFNQLVTHESLPKSRKKVTMLFQDTLLLERTVFENIIYGLKIRNNTKNLEQRVNDALKMVGLDHNEFLHRKNFQLSNGEAKRVALVSRTILQPLESILRAILCSLATHEHTRILCFEEAAKYIIVSRTDLPINFANVVTGNEPF